ncbi:hypothetical protein JOQ06_004049 [Pogonophryne albipinna]|uniref:Uncharacterized protein n=1 Tax=Pogonophryne albipinna TaxID=1090488 RepID=A0AAD6ACH6_9TELE|nr:hypothetical protein JOQ06_004049 [Pogonophryne albipinna]
MKNFLEGDLSESHEEIGLSKYEQKLCRYFERVKLKGKRGRKVAVLLTPEMVNALKLLIQKRKECGVPDVNEYLFAVPKCLSYYRGHQSLRSFADECGAKKPDYLRSTQLRKEMATTSQILNLKNNEMDQLADFLGHDISVHRQFYRLSEPTIQSAKISKLLLALEKGKLCELKGKSPDEMGDNDESEDEGIPAADTANAPDEMNVIALPDIVTCCDTLMSCSIVKSRSLRHGQRFSYWTNEAGELLNGALEPVYRVPKKQQTEHEDMLGKVKEENCRASTLMTNIHAIAVPSATRYHRFGFPDAARRVMGMTPPDR